MAAHRYDVQFRSVERPDAEIKTEEGRQEALLDKKLNLVALLGRWAKVLITSKGPALT